jgi:hypothetical protein
VYPLRVEVPSAKQSSPNIVRVDEQSGNPDKKKEDDSPERFDVEYRFMADQGSE